MSKNLSTRNKYSAALLLVNICKAFRQRWTLGRNLAKALSPSLFLQDTWWPGLWSGILWILTKMKACWREWFWVRPGLWCSKEHQFLGNITAGYVPSYLSFRTAVAVLLLVKVCPGPIFPRLTTCLSLQSRMRLFRPFFLTYKVISLLMRYARVFSFAGDRVLAGPLWVGVFRAMTVKCKRTA